MGARRRTHADRLAGLISATVVAAAVAVVLGRVFAEPWVTAVLAAAGTASAALAAATVRLRWFVRGPATAIGASLAGTVAFYPGTTWFGLPTARTWEAVLVTVRRAASLSVTEIAPVAPVRPLVIAATAAAWVAAAVAHRAAHRGRPIVALLPVVVVAAIADVSLERPPSAAVLVGILIACATVLGVDGLRRTADTDEAALGAGVLGLAAATTKGWRAVGVAAIAIAALSPTVLPGGTAPLFDVGRLQRAGGSIDPFISIRSQLAASDTIDLFSIRTSGGMAYWRVDALERFDGISWTRADGEASAVSPADTTGLLPIDEPAGDEVFVQTITFLTDLREGTPLPIAYPPSAIDPDAGVLDLDATTLSIVPRTPPRTDDVVTVVSRPLTPSPAQLDAVDFDDPLAPTRYPASLIALPDALRPDLEGLARSWTDDADTPYRKVVALQRMFHDGSFRYSLTPDPEAVEDVVTFLTRSRSGFCQQYATAMAALVRALGIPARVAIGYSTGDVRGRTTVVSNRDAHAWVEVLFPGYGWLAFEPTPGRINPATEFGTYLQPDRPEVDGGGATDAGTDGQDGDASPATTGAGCIVGAEGRRLPPQVCEVDTGLVATDGTSAIGPAGDPDGEGQGSDGSASADGSGSPGAAARDVAPIAFAAVAAVVIGIPLVKAIVRRRVGRAGRGPRAAVLAQFRTFESVARDLGVGRRPGETLNEYGVRIAGAVPEAAMPVAVLASATTRAAYAAEPPTDAEVRLARSSMHAARRAVRRSAGWRRRAVGALRPGR